MISERKPVISGFSQTGLVIVKNGNNEIAR